MENPAATEDLQEHIERPLTSDEKRVAPKWLDRAWRELNRVVPGLQARAELPTTHPSHLDSDDIVDVLVSMVERKLRNPDGKREWRGDDYGETIDASMSSGAIYVSDAEAAALRPRNVTYGTTIYSIPLTAS